MGVTDGSLTTDGAASTVRVVGTIATSPSGTQTVSGTVASNQGTPAALASAWPVQITNGTATVAVAPSAPNGLGNQLLVTTGQLIGTVTLNSATGNATGTAMDCGSAKTTCTVIAVGTGTLAGNIILEGSIDGTTYVTEGQVALTAAGTVTTDSTGSALRFYRASLTGASGAGTVTARIMAA